MCIFTESKLKLRIINQFEQRIQKIKNLKLNLLFHSVFYLSLLELVLNISQQSMITNNLLLLTIYLMLVAGMTVDSQH